MKINLFPQAILGICIVLSALVLSTLSYAIWQWHSDWILAHDEVKPMVNVTQSDNDNEVIASLSTSHLFGQSLSKLGDMPITNLQLSVTGIVKVTTQPSNSISKAYISISGQPSKIYQMGDSLPYGVKVYEITTDAVILENDGHLEKLPLPREHLKFKSKAEELL